MKRNWRRFFERLVVAAAAAFFIAVVPLPMWSPRVFLYWQVPAAVFLFVVYIGKLLIDTILFPPKSK